MSDFLKMTIKNLRDIDKPIAIITTLFFAFGLLNILSASSETVVRYSQPLFFYMQRHAFFLVIGFVMFLFIINISTKKLDKISLLLFGGALFLNILLIIVGQEHKGNLNWFSTGGQPSELAKPAIILFSAIIFETKFRRLQDKKYSFQDNLQLLIFISAVLFLLPIIVFQIHGDAGGGGLMGLISIAIFLASPIKKEDKTILIGLFTALAGLSLIIMAATGTGLFGPTQVSRLTNFRDPCSDYEGTGFQVCNSFIAINEGGIFGVGLGNSAQKHSYIPDAHTDMVFAIIAEELGFIGASLILFFKFYLLKRILDISKKACNIRGQYIALGFAFYMFFHTFINLGGLFGLIPLTGVTLPFFSYGPSFTLSFILGLALVQRVHIESVRKKIKIK